MPSNTAKTEARREEVQFHILRQLQENADHSQRSLARALGVSLGAINFCLNALVDRGYVKIRNFQASPNKLGYAYILTPKGVTSKARLTARFLRRKKAEYEALRAEINALEMDLNDVESPGR